MMPARMYDLTAMKAPVEQPVLCRDLVSAQDFSPEETKSMFELTHIIKHRPADFRGALAGKQLVLFFEKASLRTRLTFEAGMASLGGTSLFMDQTRSLLGEREPVCDIARNVERWVDAVVLRTFEHKTIVEMARHTCIPGDQRPERPGTSLPGLCRLLHPGRKVWRSQQPAPGLRRRRQQRGAFAHAGCGGAGHKHFRCDAERLRASAWSDWRRPRKLAAPPARSSTLRMMP